MDGFCEWRGRKNVEEEEEDAGWERMRTHKEEEEKWEMARDYGFIYGEYHFEK